MCAGALCCAAAAAAAGVARDAGDAATPRAARHARGAASAPPVTAADLGPPPAPGAYAPAPPADAAVYRCGNSYSARPCGASAALDVGDARSAGERRQAEDVAARDRRLGAWLAAQRGERDAQATRPPAPRKPTKGCVPTEKAPCPAKLPKTHPVATKKKAASTGAVPGASTK